MKRTPALIALALVVSACSGDASEPGAAQSTAATGATGTRDTEGAAPMTSGPACWTASPRGGTEVISFVDATAEMGLIDPLLGMRAHAAGWSDLNEDGLPDLVVGTFATARGDVYLERGADGPAPDRLLLSNADTYDIDETFPEQYGRSSGAAFIDLDGDGDDDLVLSRNVRERDGTAGPATEVFENSGTGFATADSNLDPTIGGRSIAVLDVDQDGLLDLLVLEDRYRGGSSRIYRNLGDLTFEDANADWGFPEDVHGLGVATGDLNNDGRTDIFVAGSNRLFVSEEAGLREVVGALAPWETHGNEDDVAGAAIADVNRDGWLDLVVGHHYNSTLSRGQEVPVRLYLNATDAPGDDVVLEDVTEASNLVGLPTKAPHVEIADFDNDGWPDILTSASAGGGLVPAVFRHLGVEDGVPRFASPQGLGSPQYWVTAPTADVDRDGRLDVLAVEWEPALPSILFRNDAASGHWIEISVNASLGGGIGTRVDIYETGKADDPDGLLGSREIVATVGYTAGVERFAHFGLGDVTDVDVVVTPPPPHTALTLTLAADAHYRLPNGCG